MFFSIIHDLQFHIACCTGCTYEQLRGKIRNLDEQADGGFVWLQPSSTLAFPFCLFVTVNRKQTGRSDALTHFFISQGSTHKILKCDISFHFAIILAYNYGLGVIVKSIIV